MTSIFRNYGPDAADEPGFDLDLALMTMEASECPVLVRKDPDGDWLIIAQGPPGVIHAHVVTHDDVAALGVRTLWDAAMVGAREHAERWRLAEQAQARIDREPTRIGELIDLIIDELNARAPRNREENPDAQAPDPS